MRYLIAALLSFFSPADERLFVRINYVVPGEPTKVRGEVRLSGRDLGGMLWITEAKYAGLAPLDHIYELVRIETPPSLGLAVEIMDKEPLDEDAIVIHARSYVYAVPPPVEAGRVTFRVRPEAADCLEIGSLYLFREV